MRHGSLDRLDSSPLAGTRPRVVILLSALLLMGAAVPSAAEAKPKSTATLGLEFPAQGRVGFNHFVFKLRRGKPLTPGAAKKLRRGSRKVGKGVRARLRLRPGNVPRSVVIVAGVGAIKGKGNLIAVDVALLHAGAGAQAAGARAAQGGIRLDANLLRPGSTVKKTGRTTGFGNFGRIVGRELDSDVTAADPDRSRLCAPGGNAQGNFSSYGWSSYWYNSQIYGNDVDRGLRLPPRDSENALELAKHLFCDQQVPSQLDYLFGRLQLDRPVGSGAQFSCSGVAAAPAGPNGHTFTGGGCNENIATLTFQLHGGATYTSFSVPMPSCSGLGTSVIQCTNPGNEPKMAIAGSSFGTMQANPNTVDVTAQNAQGATFFQGGIFIP